MKTTNVVFLLDETGSMENCKKDTIGGFNNFLKDQKKSKQNINFSLTLFNSTKIEKRYQNVPISEVEKLSESNYKPSNLTPLWDAIGSTINDLPKLKNALFIILTDGYENYSREFSAKTVREMIEEKKKKGWKFLYLGVDLADMRDALAMRVSMSTSTII
jgi:hypothetical protein